MSTTAPEAATPATPGYSPAQGSRLARAYAELVRRGPVTVHALREQARVGLAPARAWLADHRRAHPEAPPVPTAELHSLLEPLWYAAYAQAAAEVADRLGRLVTENQDLREQLAQREQLNAGADGA